MKIGMFIANYMDRDLETVFRMMAEKGYEAAELPAYYGNPHLDIDEVMKGNSYARKIRELVKKYKLIISAISNHPEGQLVLRPHSKDFDLMYKGTEAERIKFGMQRMNKTAKAAAALEVGVVVAWYRNASASTRSFSMRSMSSSTIRCAV